MKRRNASEEMHDVEMNGRNRYVNLNHLSPAPTPSGPRMRAGRPKTEKQTKNGSQTPGRPSGIGGVLKKKLKKKMKKKLKDKHESITFEKILRATGSPAFGSRSNLTVPAWFIKEHGDELRQSVVLRSAATKKKWAVHLGVYYPRNVAQVKFYAGWRNFAVSNGLDEGDLLVFCLRKVSHFDVYIYRKAREPDPAPSLQDAEPPRKRTKTLIHPCKKKCTKAKRSDATLTELLVAKEQVTDYDASTNPLFNSGPRQNQNDHLSCFIKKIVVSNLRDAAGYASGASLEIPHWFATTHNMQMRKSVKLRGFSERSPVRVVACKASVQRRQTRIHLRTGWSSFVSDNNLRLGQVLVFTLTGYSSFVVKEAPAS